MKPDTDVTETDVVALIMRAAELGTRKVVVKFAPIAAEDLPEILRARYKHLIGTQKTEVFDAVEEASDIVDLVKRVGKDVESVKFSVGK